MLKSYTLPIICILAYIKPHLAFPENLVTVLDTISFPSSGPFCCHHKLQVFSQHGCFRLTKSFCVGHD